ncbi:helix-turn-helix domain-containing protein [Dyella sp. 20L07]|uniref:helix-turn-helix domain-containing protein n=1 Tax=Dyella sp. 20L07 TaxID=3384240 RepID=UPI003D2AF561
MNQQWSGSSPAPRQDSFFKATGRPDRVHVLTPESQSFGGLNATIYSRESPREDVVSTTVRSNAFLCIVYHREMPPYRRWCDGVLHRQEARREGDVTFLDLRREYISDITHPFKSTSIVIPQVSLDLLADELNTRRIDPAISPNPGVQANPVLHGLCRALALTVESSGEAERLLCDYMLLAIRLQVAVTFGGLELPVKGQPASLSSWQLQRVKELMLDDLSASVGIESLASACGVSSGHFIRAFRGAIGTTPHRWRTYQRIERAKSLLALTKNPVCDIALACGFSAQSHFTRIFVSVCGVSPTVYRRLHQGKPHARDF